MSDNIILLNEENNQNLIIWLSPLPITPLNVLNREIKRRTKVVGTFPDGQSD